MVEKAHDDRHDQVEEETLDRAMTSIDPMLRASLKREQLQRRKQFLLWGGLAMMASVICVTLVMTLGDPGDIVKNKNDNPIETAAAAEKLMTDGWKLMQSGRTDDAAVHFRQAVKLDPKSANNWNALGWSLVHQMKIDDATKAFDATLKLQQDHPAALNGLGHCHYLNGKFAEAETVYRRAFDAAPAARMGLARVLLLQRKFDEASAVLAKVADGQLGSDVDQSLIEAMKSAADERQLSKQLARQLSPGGVANSSNDGPDAVAAREANAKGWQLFNAGKARAAEVAFRAALAQQSDFPAAQNGLGFAILNQGKPKEALPIFEKLVEAEPDHPGFVNGLARAYMESGDTEQAIKVWRTADQDQRVDAVTWGLARALTQQGELKEALRYWQRIDKAAPNNAMVKKMIAKCGG